MAAFFNNRFFQKDRILAAAGFPWFFAKGKRIVLPVSAMVILYNVVCGWLVGGLFRNDPRSEALAFVEREIPPDAVLEVSGSVPRVQDLPERHFQIIKIPIGIGRDERFAKMFAGDRQMEEATARWSVREMPDWFAPGAREARGTGWVLWNTIDMDANARPDHRRLLDGQGGFEMVFDHEGPGVPWWAYPRHTEFLHNRMTIWKKSGAARNGGTS